MSADEERLRRSSMWQRICEIAPSELTPNALRAIGVYGGAQGIWVDASRTADVAPSGVTVGILHTGRHYADHLSDDGIIYHYPQTRRSKGRDAAEVQATKNALLQGLPIFVVFPGVRSSTRSVRLGWVLDFDDEARQFLIAFGEMTPPSYQVPAKPDEPFSLEDDQPRSRRSALARPGQQRFRFQVIERYGCKCAVCDIRHSLLVEAAHIRGKLDRGCDDWRNGLPLCPTHHAAFDAFLFAIEPTTRRIHCKSGVNREGLGLTTDAIMTLRNHPHHDALSWRWTETMKAWKTIEDGGGSSEGGL